MATTADGVARISEVAVIARSGPAYFWRSPIASMRANRALAWASVWAIDCEELRSVTAEIVSKPTAITVSRIISDSVTTKAKPGLGRRMRLGIRGWNEVFKTVVSGNAEKILYIAVRSF